MYFSKLTLSAQRDPRAWSILGDEYALHQAVWGLFADHAERKRDFLYRREENQPGLTLYAVSKRPPEQRDGIWSVQPKDYDPRVSIGERLRFSLRVSPTRAKPTPGGRGKRVDVVMDEKKRLERDNVPKAERPPIDAIAQEHGSMWLMKRQDELGVVVDSQTLMVHSYRQHAFRKSSQKQEVKFSTLDFEGTCIVRDPEALRHALFEGVGPAKGFGCGLLLVRRA